MAGFQELVSIDTEAKPASLLCLDQKLTRVLFDWPGSYRAQIQEKKYIMSSIPLNTSPILMVQTKQSVKENSSLNVGCVLAALFGAIQHCFRRQENTRCMTVSGDSPM